MFYVQLSIFNKYMEEEMLRYVQETNTYKVKRKRPVEFCKLDQG